VAVGGRFAGCPAVADLAGSTLPIGVDVVGIVEALSLEAGEVAALAGAVTGAVAADSVDAIS
jgi:hypothetical protein